MTLKLYEPQWSWKNETEKWLIKKFEGKTILNFPCGKSQIGFRVDINQDFKPDLIADLKNPLKYFEAGSFDVVICDPPFSMFNRQGWYNNLARIAKEDFLISTPYMRAYIRNFDLYKTYLSQQDANFYLRLWLHFKRNTEELTRYD